MCARPHSVAITVFTNGPIFFLWPGKFSNGHLRGPLAPLGEVPGESLYSSMQELPSRLLTADTHRHFQGRLPETTAVPRFARAMPATLHCSSVTVQTAVDAARDLSGVIRAAHLSDWKTTLCSPALRQCSTPQSTVLKQTPTRGT